MSARNSSASPGPAPYPGMTPCVMGYHFSGFKSTEPIDKYLESFRMYSLHLTTPVQRRNELVRCLSPVVLRNMRANGIDLETLNVDGVVTALLQMYTVANATAPQPIMQRMESLTLGSYDAAELLSVLMELAVEAGNVGDQRFLIKCYYNALPAMLNMHVGGLPTNGTVQDLAIRSASLVAIYKEMQS